MPVPQDIPTNRELLADEWADAKAQLIEDMRNHMLEYGRDDLEDAINEVMQP